LIKNDKTSLFDRFIRAGSVDYLQYLARRYKRLLTLLLSKGRLPWHLGYSMAELADEENFSLDKILVESINGCARF